MDTAALVTCGESRFEHLHRIDADSMVIAVNAAANDVQADWVAALDADIIPKLAAPKVGYITHTMIPVPSDKQRLTPGIYGKKRDTLPDECQTVETTSPCNYTFPCALQAAYAMAEHVTIIGWDCNRTPHALSTKPNSYLGSRWLKELSWVRYLWDDERTTVYGRVHPAALSWVRGQGDIKQLKEALQYAS